MIKTSSIILISFLTSIAVADLVNDGLIIHLDASAITSLSNDDPVLTWSDLAVSDSVGGTVSTDPGYGIPTYRAGVINGLPAVRFVRSNQDVLVSPSWNLPDPDAGLTILTVCTGGTSTGVERVVQVGSAIGTASHLVGVEVAPSRSGCRYNNGYSLTPTGQNPISAGVFHIAVRQMPQGGRHDNLFYAVNGIEAQTIQANNPANTITFDSAGNHISVGCGMSPDAVWYPDFYDGDLAEVLVYNKQLTTAQMTQIGHYLSGKYALPFTTSDILIEETDNETYVREGGYGDEIFIRLADNPGNLPVTVRFYDILDPDQIQATPAEIVFTSANWQTPQAITISAIDDPDMERAVHDTHLAIKVDVDSASPWFGINLPDRLINIEDNDCGSHGFHVADLNLDCQVDINDFEIFIREWFECFTPDPDCQNLPY